MRINAVSVVSSDIPRTVSFFSIIGFKFPEQIADADHIEAITEPGQTRLMIDSKGLFITISGEPPRPANHSAFAIEYTTPSEIDAVIAKLREQGFVITKEPWKAFWGQYYAIVCDQDGHLVDLYSPL
jgi:uncharacterized glyoxalase superfamily protein PhnB